MKWSDEAEQLRELCLDKIASNRSKESQAMLHQSFVQQYFKTLWLQDNHITEVDANVQQFSNLRQLSLTGNHIKEIHYLPPKLEVLRICGNRCN